MRALFITTGISTLVAVSAHAATFGVTETAFALGNEGRTLVTLAGPSGPGAVDLSFAGGAILSLDTIAYRPKTNQLYGYDDATDAVYLIDTVTGTATQVVSNPGVTTNDDAGFDFNNVLDAARIVTAEDENVVFFPNKTPPTLEPKTDLYIRAGDPNEGLNPNAVMNAYTNAVPDATETMQYILDSDWNILGTLANNAGIIDTIGGLFYDGMAFDITEDGGFDILSFSEGDNTAFALLTSGNMQAIYEVPLMADANGQVNLSMVSTVTMDYGQLDGFAVVPGLGPNNAPAPVPLPGALGLLGGGLAAMAVWSRRRG